MGLFLWRNNDNKDFLIDVMNTNNKLILHYLQDDYAEVYQSKIRKTKMKIVKLPNLFLAICNPYKNIIYVNENLLMRPKNQIQHVLMHEQYHLGSSDNQINKCGLYNIKKVGAAINEGYTEYLVSRTLNSDNDSSYYADLISTILFFRNRGLLNHFKYNYFIGNIYDLATKLGCLLNLDTKTVLGYFAYLDKESILSKIYGIESDLSIKDPQIIVNRCNLYAKKNFEGYPLTKNKVFHC